MMKGYFIAFEGGEGSGKSTLLAMVAKRLTEMGYSVTTTRAPGGTDFGAQIRNAILHPSETQGELSTKAVVLAMLADRVQQIEEVIKPALAKGHVVLSDRFYLSSICYQGYAQGLGVEYVMDLSRRTHGNLWPDQNIIIDIPAIVGRQRVLGRGLVNSYDLLCDEFHEKVRDGYIEQSKVGNPNCVLIDGNDVREVVFDRVMKEVMLTLNKN